MSQKLNQIVAIEKGVKSRVYGEITEMHKAAQKPDLFNGFVKTYRKKTKKEKIIRRNVRRCSLKPETVLAQAARLLTEIMDVTATKDYANCHASADVVLDGQVLSKTRPRLIFFFWKSSSAICTPSSRRCQLWMRPTTGVATRIRLCFKTAAIPTQRTKKVQKPLVLYPATAEHPAQTQMITEDIVVGYWDTIKQSGALPVPRKQVLLERIEKLSQAVKFAREQANSAEAEPQKVGGTIFAYLLS
jgi:hypothetical protein